MKVQVIDLETQNNPYYGAVSSPHHPDNYVVAVGQVIESVPMSGEVTGKYFSSAEESRREGWLHIPPDVDMLVAHNAPFEMDWALHNHPDVILPFLARGGRVFCTAYAEYLLTNQQTTYPSLNDTAPKYGGTMKVDGIKILWEQGHLTSQIDKSLLFDEYLLGPGGDIENTRRVFWGQWQELHRRGMLKMALGRMEGMLYNCFAMHAGLHVDRDIALRLKAEAEAKLKELGGRFAEFRKHIPEVVGFKDSSDYHMSAWLFGGPIKYEERDVWYEEDGVTPKYEKADFYKFGPAAVPALASMFLGGEADTALQQWEQEHGPVHRYASGKNKGQVKVFREDTDVPTKKKYDRVFQCPALVDVSKFDKETRRDFESEFTGKRTLADDTPVYSTGKDCIEMLLARKEIAPEVKALLRDLLEFNRIDKDLGTYYLREVADAEGNVIKQSGMLQYLTPQNIVYHTLNCTSTVTTRLSSNRPNMQNLPRGDKGETEDAHQSEVKRMFTSRYGANGVILEADYTALEVVALAAFSRDKNLIKALLKGIDMHCMRLAQSLGEPYEEVLKKAKDKAHPEYPKYSQMRTDIKPRAFAYQYGATARGIAYATGCSVEEAQAFIDAEMKLFPEVEEFYDKEVSAYVKSHTTTHREELAPGQWRAYRRGVWVAPGGTCYEFREYPKTVWADGKRIDAMQFKPTQIRNYPIQGESGFFVQIVAGQVMRWLVSRGFFGGKVCIVNQVHDALYLDVHKSVLQEVAANVKRIMEALPQTMKHYGYDLGVPFPAAVEAGPNMKDKEEIVFEQQKEAA